MASLAGALAETFLPAACTSCSQALPWPSEAGVCEACWSGLLPHVARCCPRCGEPDVTTEEECLGCRNTPPAWDAALSWGPYEGRLREAVLLLKGGRDELARPLALRLCAAMEENGWPAPDAVSYVPATLWRRLRRGFDQAEELARVVASRLHRPLLPALRRRRSARQVGRSRSERLGLSATAFPARRRLSGRVLLIDDVLTTGATANACARSLRTAGAAAVLVLTVARTPSPGRIP